MERVIDRLISFQQSVKDIIGGQNKFETHIGLSTGYISNMKKNNGGISSDVMLKLKDKFSNLNLDWLITGEGPMLKPDISMPDNSAPQNVDMQIIHQSDAVEKVTDIQGVPLFDVDAAANLQTLFTNKTQNIIGQINIPNVPKCDGALYVRGDSMYPLLKSGDIVAFKQIQLDLRYIHYGEMYLVSIDEDGDEYLVVKYVNKSDIPGCVQLVSYNTHHQPKDVELASIRAMALIKFSIRMNTMR